MLIAFTLNEGRLNPLPLEVGQPVSATPAWIDAIAPTPDERQWLEHVYPFTLPWPEHLRDIEASARFYEENGSLHLRSDFLLGKEGLSRSVIVAFVLHGGILFSVHEEDLPVFQRLRTYNLAHPGTMENSNDVLIDLYSMEVEFTADALEGVYSDLGQASHAVLSSRLSDATAASMLTNLALAEHLNSRIRRNGMDSRRAISFLMRSKLLSPAQIEESRQILLDIDSLDGHTAFLSDKINFMMDAIVGFININQNKIVRLFSVASVALLPPVLIASIYGMNFHNIPELRWYWGYPFALLLMLLSVIVPFWFFHRKGWLK